MARSAKDNKDETFRVMSTHEKVLRDILLSRGIIEPGEEADAKALFEKHINSQSRAHDDAILEHPPVAGNSEDVLDGFEEDHKAELMGEDAPVKPSDE